MGVYYFAGEDTYAARQAIAALAKEKKAQIQWREAEELRQLPVGEWVGQGVSLFGATLTVFKDVQRLPASWQEQLVTLLTGAKHLVVVWERRSPDRRSRIWKQWGKAGRLFSYPPVSELTAWLMTAAAARGSTFKSEAATRLIEHYGFDRWRLLSELEKLTVQKDTIHLSDLEDRVGQTETSIFAALEALALGQAGSALAQFERLWEAGESELYVLTMLAYQFRVLAAIKTGDTADFKPFVIQKNEVRARRWSREAALAGLTKILATDFAIKQGKMDPRTGVTMLVLSLAPQSPVYRSGRFAAG